MDDICGSCYCRPVALKFRRNVVVADGTPWGKSMFVFISPVLTRGQTAELPKPAGIGIVFKVGPDGGLIVKSMAEDGPAKLSGKINLEDCLMGVDGRKVFGQSITQVGLAPQAQPRHVLSDPNARGAAPREASGWVGWVCMGGRSETFSLIRAILDWLLRRRSRLARRASTLCHDAFQPRENGEAMPMFALAGLSGVPAAAAMAAAAAVVVAAATGRSSRGWWARTGPRCRSSSAA